MRNLIILAAMISFTGLSAQEWGSAQDDRAQEWDTEEEKQKMAGAGNAVVDPNDVADNDAEVAEVDCEQ